MSFVPVAIPLIFHDATGKTFSYPPTEMNQGHTEYTHGQLLNPTPYDQVFFSEINLQFRGSRSQGNNVGVIWQNGWTSAGANVTEGQTVFVEFTSDGGFAQVDLDQLTANQKELRLEVKHRRNSAAGTLFLDLTGITKVPTQILSYDEDKNIDLGSWSDAISSDLFRIIKATSTQDVNVKTNFTLRLGTSLDTNGNVLPAQTIDFLYKIQTRVPGDLWSTVVNGFFQGDSAEAGNPDNEYNLAFDDTFQQISGNEYRIVLEFFAETSLYQNQELNYHILNVESDWSSFPTVQTYKVQLLRDTGGGLNVVQTFDYSNAASASVFDFLADAGETYTLKVLEDTGLASIEIYEVTLVEINNDSVSLIVTDLKDLSETTIPISVVSAFSNAVDTTETLYSATIPFTNGTYCATLTIGSQVYKSNQFVISNDYLWFKTSFREVTYFDTDYNQGMFFFASQQYRIYEDFEIEAVPRIDQEVIEGENRNYGLKANKQVLKKFSCTVPEMMCHKLDHIFSMGFVYINGDRYVTTPEGSEYEAVGNQYNYSIILRLSEYQDRVRFEGMESIDESKYLLGGGGLYLIGDFGNG